MTTPYAGLDIAKRNLQLHLAAQPGVQVVCDATGGL